MCIVAEELNFLDLAPLLGDGFLVFKSLKIALYLYSITAVSALINLNVLNNAGVGLVPY